MKKLMIAAAIVCAAVASQAAGVKWATSALYNADGAKVLGTAKAYIYMLADETAFNNLTDVWGTYKADILDNAGEGASKTGVSQSWNSTITATYPGSDATPNTTYYAAIITTYGTGDDMMYIAEKLSATTGEDGATTQGFATAAMTAESAATAWKSAAAAPEPTSGLLLLLGVAGLALKRRRA